MNYYVYKHTFSNGVIYIGKGKHNRISIVKRNRYWTNLYNKYGEPKKEYLVKDITESMAFTLEKAYIMSEKAFGSTLCNMTDGGDGISGYQHSDKAKEKIRKANKGKKLSPETRKRMSETRRKLKSKGNSLAGAKAVSRSITQYSMDGKLILSYNSITEASKATGINRGNISSVCKGRYKQAGGYKWTYNK